MKNTENMTACQRGSYKDVINYITSGGHYEIKEEEVTMMEDGDAYIIIARGLVNDEGTIAEFLCRDHYIFFIGRRGGIYTYEGHDFNYYRAYHKYYSIPKAF